MSDSKLTGDALISDDDLRNLRTSAALATPGPWFSCGGKANARVQARVPLAGGGHARYILCALTRSGWRGGSQTQNDAYFISLMTPELATALVNEVLAYRGHQCGQSSDRDMLRQLAVILSGSDTPGEIKSLTVTAQSYVDRCKQLARDREKLSPRLNPEPMLHDTVEKVYCIRNVQRDTYSFEVNSELARLAANNGHEVVAYTIPQPAPVMPSMIKGVDEYSRGWNDCRAAMLKGASTDDTKR